MASSGTDQGAPVISYRKWAGRWKFGVSIVRGAKSGNKDGSMRQGAMTPDRWKEIKEIFEEALTQPVLTRANVVHTLCHGDQHLEAEVKDLLGAHESADGFLEKPAVDLRGYLTAVNRQPSFTRGSIIAKRFEILSFLNRGGMV